MRKILLTTLLAFILLISLNLVSAEVDQNQIIRHGIIEDDNSLTQTTTPILDSELLGFICSSGDCSTVSGTLFNGNPVIISQDELEITFPTNLQDQGYGLFFYKPGFIPFEVKSVYSGSGQAPDGSRYLTQKRTCTVPLSNLQVNENTGLVTVTFEVDSPINHAGPINLVPGSIVDQYTADIISKVSVLNSVNSLVYESSKTTNLPFSESQSIIYTFNLSPGNYTITAGTISEDEKCLDTNIVSQTENFVVPQTPDTTPPGQITNLALESKTNTTLSWTWNNPTDSDFANAIVSIDGINVINTTDEMYLASNLAPNSTHEISIKTIDTSGNINNNQVSRTDTTLPNTTPPIIDTTPPNSIDNLQLTDVTNTTLSWTWNNPIIDFFKAIIFLDGVNVQNTTNNMYLASGLVPNSTHTITVHTIDTSGNINNTDVSSTGTTSINTTDTTPPGQAINLQLIDKTNTTLSWNWTAPTDIDFSHYLVSLDGTPYIPTNFNTFVAQSLAPNSTHTIYVQTVDTSGNVNTNPVTNTATTLANTIPPVDPNANLSITINSPEAKTYNVSDILIDITSEGTSTWFSLDSSTNETYTSPTSKTFLDGFYTLTAYTQNSFGNVNSTSVSFNVNTTIPNPPVNDTTAPSSITNLTATEIKRTSITWSWNNPTDSDFSHVILYLDGINALNTSDESATFLGLTENTTYTLIAHTSDFSGNINNTDVTSVATTLPPLNTTGDSGQTPSEDLPTDNSDENDDSTSTSGGGSKSSSSGKTYSSTQNFIPLTKSNKDITVKTNQTQILLQSEALENKSRGAILYIPKIWIYLLILLVILIVLALILTR